MTIQNVLKESGLSKYQVSKHTGIAFSTISDIFSGKRQLESCSSKTVQLLSVLFGYSIEDLLRLRNNGEHSSADILPVQSICDACKTVFEKEDISEAYLFGSYARGEAKADSDIDIVIYPKKDLGTRILRINSILESKLGKSIDIYSYDEIPFLMPTVEKEKRLIYHETVH